MIIESSFASVTAPSVDILSPGIGRLELAVGPAGHMVKRDDQLFELKTAAIEADLELARARVAAALTQYAPCDCVVSWVEEDGAWLIEGDPLMTLAKIGPDHLRVEALIPLVHAKGFTPGQSAFVRLSGTDELIPAGGDISDRGGAVA